MRNVLKCTQKNFTFLKLWWDGGYGQQVQTPLGPPSEINQSPCQQKYKIIRIKTPRQQNIKLSEKLYRYAPLLNKI